MAATSRILPLKQLLRLLKQTLLRRRLCPDLPLHLQLQQRQA
jgi:hypothetical protein